MTKNVYALEEVGQMMYEAGKRSATLGKPIPDSYFFDSLAIDVFPRPGKAEEVARLMESYFCEGYFSKAPEPSSPVLAN